MPSASLEAQARRGDPLAALWANFLDSGEIGQLSRRAEAEHRCSHQVGPTTIECAGVGRAAGEGKRGLPPARHQPGHLLRIQEAL